MLNMKKFILILISIVLLTSCSTNIRKDNCCVVTEVCKYSNQYRYLVEVYDNTHCTRNYIYVYDDDLIYNVGDTLILKKVEK